MSKLGVALACAVSLTACDHAEPPHRPGPDPVRDAKAEFEAIDHRFIAAIQIEYTRGELLGYPFSTAAFDAGDFADRLAILFGPPPGDFYVLRHRATGIVVAAGVDEHGPMYGGGLRYVGVLPADPVPTDEQLASERKALTARLRANPQVMDSRMLDLVDAADKPTQTADELAASNRTRAVVQRFKHDVEAPEGVPAVVARLDALVEAIRPPDLSDGLDRLVDDSLTKAQSH